MTLVVGAPEVFDLRREYRFPPFAAAKVEFCGYIARQPGQQSRAEVRRALDVQDARALVLVTPGGGEDGHALIDACLAGLRTLPAPNRPRTHIVCGPEMAEVQRVAIKHAATALPQVSVQDFSDDMMSLMAAADVVVAMGGYNTVCELLTLRKRAVIVPRVKPSLEQCLRAERMAALGLLRMLHPEQLTPAALLDAVQTELAALSGPTTHSRLASLDGLARTTAAIFELIDLRPPATAGTTPPATDDASRRPHHRNQAPTRGTPWHRHVSTAAAPSAC